MPGRAVIIAVAAAAALAIAVWLAVAPTTHRTEMQGWVGRGEKVGILFGPERTGLTNDYMVLVAKTGSQPATTRPL